MTSEKKITLNHFANINLKERDSNAHGIKMLYPLYLDIIYRRQHIQIKSIIDTPVTKELDNLDPASKILLSKEKELIQKIIRFEESELGDNHRIAGLGKRLTNYRASIFVWVDDYLRVKLKKAILEYVPDDKHILNFDSRNIPFERVFDAAKALWPKLDSYINLDLFQQEISLWKQYFDLFPRKEYNKLKYPAFIDWLADDHNYKFRNILLKVGELDETLVDESLSYFNNILRLATIDQ